MTFRLAMVAVVTILVASVGAVTWGTRRFRTVFEAEKQRLLDEARAAPAQAVMMPSDVTKLPRPVQRYLATTGGPSRRPLRAAHLKQTGRIRTGPDKDWIPLVSEQVYAFQPAGFVWFADARVAPLLHLFARDKFVDGRGNMWIKLMGLITVADSGGPEIDQGAALRYWGEILAFPEVLSSPQTTWEPIDERRARVTMNQGAIIVRATIDFDEHGYPVATHADRFRDVQGRPVLTPWSGYSRAWKDIDGRRFPTQWESVWHLPGGDFPAVQMEIRSVMTE
jgi:hypothetical protein